MANRVKNDEWKLIVDVVVKDNEYYYQDDNSIVYINGKPHEGFIYKHLYKESFNISVSKRDHESLFKRPGKGEKFGICNRGACDSTSHVIFHNHSTKKYYCIICTRRINSCCEGESYFPLCKASIEDMIAVHGERAREYTLGPT